MASSETYIKLHRALRLEESNRQAKADNSASSANVRIHHILRPDGDTRYHQAMSSSDPRQPPSRLRLEPYRPGSYSASVKFWHDEQKLLVDSLNSIPEAVRDLNKVLLEKVLEGVRNLLEAAQGPNEAIFEELKKLNETLIGLTVRFALFWFPLHSNILL